MTSANLFNFCLTFYKRMCHFNCEVLEVFVTIEATKTLSFVAFLFDNVFLKL